MIKNKILVCLLAVVIVMGSSCKDSLEDFDPEGGLNVKVSAMPQTGTVTKETMTISVPLDVALSAASPAAFEVELKDNQDTIQMLIDNGTLQNTVLLPSGTYDFPNVINVPYGVKKTTFNVSININTIEKNYGKKVAFAVNLNSPSKGNSLDTKNKTFVIVLETAALLTLEEIRYLSFDSGTDGRLLVPTAKNYSVSSGGIVVPVKIKLNGTGSGPAFNVRLSLNPDTLNTLISKGQIPPSTLAIKRSEYSLDTVVKIKANQTEIAFNITVPLSLINNNLGRYLGISVNLDDATRNLIDPLKKNLIILLNTLELAEKDITNQGVLSVSKENNGGVNAGEGSPKLIDNNLNTKYLISGFGGIWIQLKFPNLVTAKAYTLTSGNDATDRDPKSWTLEGSNDGVNWTVLDTREGETFSDRTLTKRYEFTNNSSYTYYKLDISENAGSSDFQLSEFRLIQLP